MKSKGSIYMERWWMVKVSEASLASYGSEQCVFAAHHICCIVVYLKHLICKGQGRLGLMRQLPVCVRCPPILRSEEGNVHCVWSYVHLNMYIYMQCTMYNGQSAVWSVQFIEAGMPTFTCSGLKIILMIAIWWILDKYNFHLPWLEDPHDDGNWTKIEIGIFWEIH